MNGRAIGLVVLVALAALSLFALAQSETTEIVDTPAEGPAPAATPTEAMRGTVEAVSDTSTTADPAPRVEVEPDMATVRGRGVDEEGRPLAGCTASVESVRSSREAFRAYVAANGKEPERVQVTVTTTADGIFALRFVPAAPWRYE
ncbi:MAG: hypothetical protein ABL886_08685 [Rhodoglobus sp.]